ncbi:geranylgeranylglyceryl/heptaprenylglyceryl phosphate synthase [Candidatus Aenigmatarchaeota archaeon]
MKILVTGGTGFVGSRLVKKLKRGNKVFVLSHKNKEELEDEAIPGVTYIKGDVMNKKDIRKAFPVDVVYHLAACLDESNPDMYDINAVGTMNLVDVAKENKVKQIIFMGSSGVLGETKEPAREDMSYNPKTDYERSKTVAEKEIIKSGIKYTVIRSPVMLGPNNIWFLIFAAAKKQYPIIGSGKNKFHLSYVKDVVSLLEKVKNNKKAYNQIFHVATKDTPSYKEVYQMMCDELKIDMTEKHVSIGLVKLASTVHTASRKVRGKKPKLTMMKSSIDRLIRNRTIDITKSKKVLRFSPRYDTKTAIKETVEELLKENVKAKIFLGKGITKLKNVEKYIKNKINKDGAIISIIIDPVDYKSEGAAVKTALMAWKAGVDIIAVGGSIGAQGDLLNNVTKAIKEKVDVPVVLFPGNIATITPYADAIYFMSLLNSRNPYWISQAQTLAAPLVKQFNIEALPIGYIVVEPGGTVGWVGDSNDVPRNKPQIAAGLGMAGELMGNRIIFTDAGSAAHSPVPIEMVKKVRKYIDVPYLVAGGIKTPSQAYEIVKAGGDWIQIGTAAERTKNPLKTLKLFVSAVKRAGKKRNVKY